ncbi:nucleotidyltransferase [Chitinophaga varians]|uniref:nucleotidyltransferase n=1 Tax=Chitinophaga varians TaxID=2202339 RepID=UPI00165FD9CE|nr:nucleotidyltransferase [Chitinophaga varians]MBC9912923.1 nucleotidyltransferase [Chitinophaga varians]
MKTCPDESNREAHAFYQEALHHLNNSSADYMLGGAFAMFYYTGIYRDTKDLDIFCKWTEYPKILQYFSAQPGYRVELTDVRWLAKVYKGDFFLDIIFDTVNNICRVDDSWYQHTVTTTFEGVPVKLMAPEELVWCKIYVQNRERFDGADINHILLRHKPFDWKRLLFRLDQHWHLLLAQLLIFQFVYPADYPDIIPRWLFDELMDRARQQYELPRAVEKVCRGPFIDQTQYEIDVKIWDYKAYTIKTV